VIRGVDHIVLAMADAGRRPLAEREIALTGA
jgi:hypothetical protein